MNKSHPAAFDQVRLLLEMEEIKAGTHDLYMELKGITKASRTTKKADGMTTKQLKDKEKNTTYRTRLVGYPTELITLKNGNIVGGYGVRSQGPKQWERLVDDGWLKNMGIKDKELSWITSKQIKKIEAWTPKRQAALEQSQKYQQQKIKIKEEQVINDKEEFSNQSKLAFASEQALFIIKYPNNEKRLSTDF